MKPFLNCVLRVCFEELVDLYRFWRFYPAHEMLSRIGVEGKLLSYRACFGFKNV